jgi:hypothetical protein
MRATIERRSKGDYMDATFSQVADALLAFADCIYTVDEVIERTGISDRVRAEEILETIKSVRGD